MNYTVFDSLVIGTICTVSGTLVFLHNPRSVKNLIFTFFHLSLAAWSFCRLMWILSDNPISGLFWARALMVGCIFLPVLHYHHLLSIFNIGTPKRLLILKVSYGLSFLCLFFVFSPFFIARVEERFSFQYWLVPGPLAHPYFVMWFGLLAMSLYLLFEFRKKAPPTLRNNATWMIVATTIGWIGGGTNIPLFYNIPIPPFLNILIIVYVLVITLLYFRLQLLDVRTFFKHLSILILIYSGLLVLTLPLAIPLAMNLLNKSDFSPIGVLLSFSVGLGVIFSGGPFLYAFLVRRNFWLKKELTKGLTHELKAPLTTIQSSMDVIRDALTKPHLDRSMLKDYLGVIESNISRLDTHVRDLLHVARIQEQAIQINKRPNDLSALIEDVVKSFHPLTQAKALSVQVEKESLPLIPYDVDKMKQVFSNLLSNAIKFSTNGTITFKLVKETSYLRCSIEDQGSGMAPQDLDRIFDRFYQGKNSSKGSGIGLTIAKAWVEAHGGRIWAESEGKGKGSQITFTIPSGT